MAMIMLFSLLPVEVFAEDAANQPSTDISTFFTDIGDRVQATNSDAYPMTIVTPEGETETCLQSGNASKGSSESGITLQILKPINLSFQYSVSSEKRWDYLKITRNGNELTSNDKGSYSGTVDWQIYTLACDAGDTLQISYSKDSSGDNGSDCIRLKAFKAALLPAINFHANDGSSPEKITQQVIANQTIALKQNMFSREGYVFAGWATSAGGEVCYQDQASVGAPESGNLDLYAVWQRLYQLHFQVTPADAQFTLYADDAHKQQILLNSDNGTFSASLTPGTYYYAASAFGYQSLENGSAVITEADKTVTLALVPNALCKVTFAFSGKDTSNIVNRSVSVAIGEQTIKSKEENGLTFDLPVGYSYQYTFRSKNFSTVKGTIDLSSATAGVQTETIPLTDKTAWGGPGEVSTPAGEGSAEKPYQITSGEELAWLAQEVNAGEQQSACAVLENDINLGEEEWTPIGSSNCPFSGSFDGAKHKINGLSIQTGNSYEGLFGYIRDAQIQNLSVSGSVNTPVASAAGGITGAMGGEKAFVENCLSDVSVTGGNNVGGIVGYVAARSKAVQGCINRGTISGSYNVGGLIGYVYYQFHLSDSYNRGTVNASGSKAGGLAGCVNDSGADVKNCYTTGAVDGKSDVCAAIGKKTSGTVSNCYALNGLPADGNAVFKTEEEMKEPEFAAALGEGFLTDMPVNINEGYPILAFQDTTPKYQLTLTVHPADATLVLKNVKEQQFAGSVSQKDEGKVYTYTLPDGDYTYSATAFGKLPAQGTINVNGAASSKEISLEDAPKSSVRFAITPAEASANAKIIVLSGDSEIQAVDGKYNLPSGTYSYVVKSKGYARVTGSLTVADEPQATMEIQISMVPSTAWDGEEIAKPEGDGSKSAPYQISDGAELAWLAQEVNAKQQQDACAVLTSDIDLGGEQWTPIGKESSPFQGSFDGAGYRIQNLYVDINGNYAGLFGYVQGSNSQNALVENLTVEGSVAVSGSSLYAGGIAGKGNYANIQSCENRAAVTAKTDGINGVGGIVGCLYDGGKVIGSANKGKISNINGENTGGIVGYVNGISIHVSRCFNIAEVSGKTKVGGVVGNTGGAVSDVYNTGAVSGTEAVGGIAGYQGADFSNAYTIGAVSGAKDVHAAFGRASSYYDRTNIFYLADLTEDTNAQSKTEQELKVAVSTLGSENWKADADGAQSINSGYPILIWQKATSAPQKLQVPANTLWKAKPEGSGYTPVAAWNAVNGADHYSLKLYKSTDSGFAEIDTFPSVYDTEFDLSYSILAAGEGEYCFTVAACAGDETALQSDESALPQSKDEAGRVLSFKLPLEQPAGLYWDGSVVHWQSCNFADGYMIYLYRLDDSGKPVYATATMTQAGVTSADFSNSFVAGAKYIFCVEAVTNDFIYQGDETNNSSLSAPSNDPANAGENGVYIVPAAPDPGDESDEGWTLITTPEQIIDLANVEDINDAGENETESRQTVAWSQKYRLKADIDFSNLSAAYAAKTKTIGNVKNRFTGIFDGNGHKITGLTLSRNDSGLFGYIGAQGRVYNLTIDGANVLFSDNAAVLAMYNYGTIEHCSVINTNITADTGAVLGGMVSRNYGIIRDSRVLGGTLKSNSNSATGHGGFVGSNEALGLIERCYTSMCIDTQSDYAGGFVGLAYGGTIRDCFALGNVSARSYSGGFAGRSVYSGNIYENCYAFNTVTVSGDGGHGFIGGSKPDSSFQPDLSKEIKNCYSNADTLPDSFATLKTADQMKEPGFVLLLNGNGTAWEKSPAENNGLPYLKGVVPPESIPTTKITVQLTLGTYDKKNYRFESMGKPVSVNIQSAGNTRVIDVLDAAKEQGLITYAYDTTPTLGRFVHTINGYSVDAPDGWMFTVNDKLSNVGVSLATVKDGDRILWYEGTTENRFLGPLWDELISGSKTTWIDIGSVADLQNLCSTTEVQKLSGHYRLTADLDLSGISISGIGSAANPFTGTLDGQGHSISNLTIDGGENAGLFGVVKGATIKNLQLLNADVKGTENVGTLVGQAQTELNKQDLSKNVANLIGNCVASGSVCGNGNVGGLVGLNGGSYDQDTLFSIYSSAVYNKVRNLMKA